MTDEMLHEEAKTSNIATSVLKILQARTVNIKSQTCKHSNLWTAKRPHGPCKLQHQAIRSWYCKLVSHSKEEEQLQPKANKWLLPGFVVPLDIREYGPADELSFSPRTTAVILKHVKIHNLNYKSTQVWIISSTWYMGVDRKFTTEVNS